MGQISVFASEKESRKRWLEFEARVIQDKRPPGAVIPKFKRRRVGLAPRSRPQLPSYNRSALPPKPKRLPLPLPSRPLVSQHSSTSMPMPMPANVPIMPPRSSQPGGSSSQHQQHPPLSLPPPPRQSFDTQRSPVSMPLPVLGPRPDSRSSQQSPESMPLPTTVTLSHSGSSQQSPVSMPLPTLRRSLERSHSGSSHESPERMPLPTLLRLSERSHSDSSQCSSSSLPPPILPHLPERSHSSISQCSSMSLPPPTFPRLLDRSDSSISRCSSTSLPLPALPRSLADGGSRHSSASVRPASLPAPLDLGGSSRAATPRAVSPKNASHDSQTTRNVEAACSPVAKSSPYALLNDTVASESNQEPTVHANSGVRTTAVGLYKSVGSPAVVLSPNGTHDLRRVTDRSETPPPPPPPPPPSVWPPLPKPQVESRFAADPKRKAVPQRAPGGRVPRVHLQPRQSFGFVGDSNHVSSAESADSKFLPVATVTASRTVSPPSEGRRRPRGASARDRDRRSDYEPEGGGTRPPLVDPSCPMIPRDEPFVGSLRVARDPAVSMLLALAGRSQRPQRFRHGQHFCHRSTSTSSSPTRVADPSTSSLTSNFGFRRDRATNERGNEGRPPLGRLVTRKRQWSTSNAVQPQQARKRRRRGPSPESEFHSDARGDSDCDESDTDNELSYSIFARPRGDDRRRSHYHDHGSGSGFPYSRSNGDDRSASGSSAHNEPEPQEYNLRPRATRSQTPRAVNWNAQTTQNSAPSRSGTPLPALPSSGAGSCTTPKSSAPYSTTGSTFSNRGSTSSSVSVKLEPGIGGHGGGLPVPSVWDPSIQTSGSRPPVPRGGHVVYHGSTNPLGGPGSSCQQMMGGSMPPVFFPCHICFKRFAKKQNLRVHLKTHSDERKFECPTCGKRFSRKGNMQRHSWTHTDSRPFFCIVCNRGFNDPSNLRKHEKNKHDMHQDH